jgi:inosose dehydratase
MQPTFSRREFAATLAAGIVAGTELAAAPKRRLKIGHTGITWGFKPENAADAVVDVGKLGYYGYESFGNVLEAWEAKGGLQPLLEQNKLKLVSAYCPVNLLDPSKKKEEVDKMVRWGKLIQKCGGRISVIGPTSVKRESFDFKAARSNIIDTLNEVSKALTDAGSTGVLHQHTGTCIESRDEVYSIMEAVDTRHVKFGPDVGQLQKGGVDPVKVVSDFRSIIEHVHLKDYDGGEHFLGYCPLGRGKVDLPKILDLLEKSKIKEMIMVELDPSNGMPMKPLETAEISKAYLQKMGYTFRS